MEMVGFQMIYEHLKVGVTLNDPIRKTGPCRCLCRSQLSHLGKYHLSKMVPTPIAS